MPLFSSCDLLWSASSVASGFRAFAQQHDAFDHVVIDYRAVFMANGFAQLSQPHFGRLHDYAQVANPHRRSILLFTTVAAMSSVVGPLIRRRAR
jgi:hypothetical protein